MALTPSTMLPLGTPMPPFALPDPDGTIVSSEQFADKKALVVAFICNHCPYVVHLKREMTQVAQELIDAGAGFVAINSNDFSNPKYASDSPEKMKEDAVAFGYPFPYLVDESQDIAQAFRAACTPDFYVFGPDRRLVYRGQFDDSRPGNDLPVTGGDLTRAVLAVLHERTILADQDPSSGCNIKWKPGNEPQGTGFLKL